MTEKPPCTECKIIQQKAKEYDVLRNWTKKHRRLTNIKEYREVYDYLLRQFQKSDDIIAKVDRTIVLLCPNCRKPFCIEPSAQSLASTVKNIEATGAQGIECAFCSHRFQIEEAKVME